jgi:hypothetical protein
VLPLRPNSPTANPGGPYTIIEGASLLLNASQSSSPDGMPLSFRWDVTGDGRQDDAFGMTPTLTWSQLQGLGITAGKSYLVTVFAGEGGGYYTISEETHLTVLGAPLQVAGLTINATKGAAFSGVIGALLDPGSDGTTTAYQVQINWGDGDNSAGTLTLTGTGAYSISGAHTYGRAGSYSLTISVQEADGTSAQAVAKASVAAAVPLISLASVKPIEGILFKGLLATFTDPGTPLAASAYAAQVNWGDGHISGGSISATGDGVFGINGSNLFAVEGQYVVAIKVIDPDGATGKKTGAILITDGALAGTSTQISANTGILFGSTVAAFRDPGTGGTVIDYSAHVNWGAGLPFFDSKALAVLDSLYAFAPNFLDGAFVGS